MSAEKADVRLALVEYRDHPPQDISFVTRVHDFTSSVSQMRNWLGECGASGGKLGSSLVPVAVRVNPSRIWNVSQVRDPRH